MPTWGKASRFCRFTVAEMHNIIVRNSLTPHTIESVIFFAFRASDVRHYYYLQNLLASTHYQSLSAQKILSIINSP